MNMAQHYKFYPASEETVVPFNATYSFPSQANKAVKLTPRIPPKNGSTFTPGQIVRFEFPAQGYVNPGNTTLEFDVVLYGNKPSTAITAEQIRFQNNIQSIFNRVRLLYGATPLEDIIDYNVIVRSLTEWTATNQSGSIDQTSVTDGIGGWTVGADTQGTIGVLNARQAYIQGISTNNVSSGTNFTTGRSLGYVPQVNQFPSNAPAADGRNVVCRRYQISFALGLFTQEKLIPTKWMASQLAIEITLEQPNMCIFEAFTPTLSSSGTVLTQPTYCVGNMNLIPEILEFDASYDAMFLQGLQSGGVPIKFCSWHTFIFATASASTVSLLIQERSRSVKSIFCLQMRGQGDYSKDNGATLFDTSSIGTISSQQYYQYRIGGRYFPGAPVQLSINLGTTSSNGGAEALTELSKALNMLNDYRLSTSLNTNRWAWQCGLIDGAGSQTQNEFDYKYFSGGHGANGALNLRSAEASGNSFSGNLGSACYACAIDLETSNGVEISGLNAEEQSDIAFIAQWSQGQASDCIFRVYTYFDAMIVLRENNTLELIQ